jgi:hypothetical protein
MSQFVYVISNPAMPDLVKIGKTCNVSDRVRQLSSSTSVPFPFELHYAAEIRDDLTHDAVESALHNAFRDCRVNEKREFFRLSPDRVIPLLELLSKPETVQDEDPTDYAKEMSKEFQNVKVPKKYNRYSFTELEIPPGTVLYFSHDSNITCTVVDDRHVEYMNENLTLSHAAVKAWKVFDRHYDSCAGMWDWSYEGERLRYRRRRYRELRSE